MKKYLFIPILFLLGSMRVFGQFPDTDPNTWGTPLFNDEFEYSDISDFYNQNCDPLNASARALPWAPNYWGNIYFHNSDEYLTYAPSIDPSNDHNFLFHPDPNYGTSSANPDNSYMTIVLKKESTPLSIGGHTYHYSSNMLFLPPAEGWKYGYFEMSFRVPNYYLTTYLPWLKVSDLDGLSCGFWMYSADATNDVQQSEIDIMENFDAKNGHTSNVHFSNNACNVSGATNQICYSAGNLNNIYFTPMVFNNNNLYHILDCEWTPDYVKIYLDHNLVRVSLPYSDRLIQMGFIIEANANASAYTSDSWRYNTLPSTVFPYKMDINYVRAWQIKKPSGGCGSLVDVVISLPPSGTFTNELKNSIKVGHISGTNIHTTVLSGQKYSLHAAKFIELEKGFTVNKGGDFIAHITPCY